MTTTNAAATQLDVWRSEVKDAIEHSGITYRDAAPMLGVNPRQLGQYIGGTREPTLESQARIKARLKSLAMLAKARARSAEVTGDVLRRATKQPRSATTMRSEATLVTPEMAVRILASNSEQNRPRKKYMVGLMSDVQREGRWQLTHESVAIDWNGNVIDGQHRLTMIIETGIPAWLYMTTGCDPETFLAIGQGLGRSAGDIYNSITHKSRSSSYAIKLTCIAGAMLRGLGRNPAPGTKARYTQAMKAELAIQYENVIAPIYDALRLNQASYGNEVSAVFAKVALIHGIDRVLPIAKLYGEQNWRSTDYNMHNLLLFHDRVILTRRRNAKIKFRASYSYVLAALLAVLEGKQLSRLTEAKEDIRLAS